MSSTEPFGVGDASYQAAGGIDGLRCLVDDFYRIMDKSASAADIRRMHPAGLDMARDKLAAFSVAGWVGHVCTVRSTVRFRFRLFMRNGRLMLRTVPLG